MFCIWFLYFSFWFARFLVSDSWAFGFWFVDFSFWFAGFSFWFSVSDSRGFVSDSCIVVSDSRDFWFLIRGILVSDSRILVSDSQVLVSDSLFLIRGKFLIRGFFLKRMECHWILAGLYELVVCKKTAPILLRRSARSKCQKCVLVCPSSLDCLPTRPAKQSREACAGIHLPSFHQ